MARVQLALNVSDLNEAIAFYTKLFGSAPAKVQPGYANFAVTDPPLKLVLMEDPETRGSGVVGALNHLGVEVATPGEVGDASRRLQTQGLETEEQQATLMLMGVREQLIKRSTQLGNAIRGYAAEFGLITAKGFDKIEPLLVRIAQDGSLPELARDMFAIQGRDHARVQLELKAIEARLKAWHRANADSRRLASIPGVGLICAAALVLKAPDPHAFPSGRHFAAWMGLTPKDHSTAGKTRIGKITRAGDEMLRSVLVSGATAVIQQAKKGRGHPAPWLVVLLARKSPKLAAIALANKIARIAWKLLTTGESYDGRRMFDASAVA